MVPSNRVHSQPPWASPLLPGCSHHSQPGPTVAHHVTTLFLKNSFPYCDSLIMLGPRSGTIRRCGLVEVGVALLEEVYHCGGGLLSSAKCGTVSLLGAFRWRCRTLSSFYTMPAWTLSCSRLDDNGLNPALIKCCPYKSCLGHGVCLQQ